MPSRTGSTPQDLHTPTTSSLALARSGMNVGPRCWNGECDETNLGGLSATLTNGYTFR
jgi:hypothetical protein